MAAEWRRTGERGALMLRYREAARALRAACDEGAGELSKIVGEQRMSQEKLDRDAAAKGSLRRG